MVSAQEGISDFDQSALNEINKMRNNPQSMLPHLAEALEQYKKPNLPQDSYLRNFFSYSSFENTIKLCKDIEAVTNQLRWCPDLAKAAQDHVLELGPKGMELNGRHED